MRRESALSEIRLWFELEGRGVEVVTDDPSLRDLLRATFPAYALEHGAAGGVTESVMVRRRGVGWLVNPGPAQTSCADLPSVVTTVEFAVTEALLRACADRVQLHASGAVVRGRAVLATGASDIGKSSLGAAWSAAGHAVLGDDVVFLDPTGQAWPFKRVLKVVPVVLHELGLSPMPHPGGSDAAEAAWYDPARGAGWAAAAPVGLLAFPAFRPGAATTVERVSAAASLERLLESIVVTGLDRRHCFEPLARLAESVAGYRVTFGSARDAARVLADHV